MKTILLIGAGQFGVHLAKKLNELGHEIMAVDSLEERVDRILPYCTSAQIGDASDSEFLETLGIEDYDVCFITIGDNFQDSLETTSLVKEMGGKIVVARASNDVHAKFLLRNGADQIFYQKSRLRTGRQSSAAQSIFSISWSSAEILRCLKWMFPISGWAEP